MAWAQIAGLLGKAGPQVAKQLPKLWPMLLESKNREKLGGFFVDLTNNSPAKRLRARVELTAALADTIAEQAKTQEEGAEAEAWSRRARNLLRRLDMPVAGRKAKTAHRHAIREQLETLQEEMNRGLDASP
jgi:uncharacterized protein YerC